MNDNGASPFNPRAVLALVLFGGLVFVALLWMIGTGMTGGNTNDGGGHASGKGLNGYAALAGYLERRGYSVQQAQNEGMLNKPGLLVLTPEHDSEGSELEDLVQKRRYQGPTLIISPKWRSIPIPARMKGAKPGWVMLGKADTPSWRGFLDDVGVNIRQEGNGTRAGWHADGVEGDLPDSTQVLAGTGDTLIPLVESQPGGRILAALIRDDGVYPRLEDMRLSGELGDQDDEDLYPLVVVFEPDLLNNYGMAKPGNARLADKLLTALGKGAGSKVTFDLTLNGHGRTANLLTLAFQPPFLAATLCLLIAALAAGWRAFLRFGPPRRAGPSIAFGKRALVSNAAALIRRTRRLHLIAGPYAEHARERHARALALPRMADAEATEAAIDRALASRRGDAPPFSVIAARLRAARGPYDMLKAAKDLHSLERTLKR
ncbi:MAG: DUF4350 domain-containing protein [Novosphingobium sp.]